MSDIADAIFSDETMEYVMPSEPKPDEIITIKLRAPRRGIDRVELVMLDREVPTKMLRSYSDEFFQYYEVSMMAHYEPIRYYFQIKSGPDTIFYTRVGADTVLHREHVFTIIPGFTTPEWAKGAIMYQIFVDRFRRENKNNDVLDDEYIYIGMPARHIEDWNEYPSPFDVGYFYGGDLSGVLAKLDYLKELGVEVIYLNPIFVSPSNHKYDTQDYEHIDPHYTTLRCDYGEVLPEDATDNSSASKYICRTTDKENLDASDDFFAEFVKAIHKAGMKVIIDGVFNHCGSFNKWLDREGIYKNSGKYAPGAYESEHSPYKDFFTFSKTEHDDWPNNGSYDGWWGNDTLPKLNYEGSEQLINNILGIAAKWLRPPYSVDGWRLDVAADLGHSEEFNHYFWKQFRKVVKRTNPEALILAEHYGDPSSWLCGDEWDTVMNYDGFMEPVSWFLTGMEKHSDRSDMSLKGNGKAFFDMMIYAKARMPMPSYMTAMNELSNHDHSRFLTRTNGYVGRLATEGSVKASENIDQAVMRQAIVLQMTWQGAPTIYYGDEAGTCGWTDPDSRRTYPWGHEQLELLDFHTYVNLLHQRHRSLRKGSLIPISGEQGHIAYGRVLGKDKVLVVITIDAAEEELQIPVWKMGVHDYNTIVRVAYTDCDGYNVGEIQEYVCQEGILNVHKHSKAAAVFVIR